MLWDASLQYRRLTCSNSKSPLPYALQMYASVCDYRNIFLPQLPVFLLSPFIVALSLGCSIAFKLNVGFG